MASSAGAWKDYDRAKTSLSLVLSLVIGALVGLVVVAFILLTGRLAARMYPAGGSGWRRILVPVLGSLSTGYLLWRYFPFARGSGIPQTKFALFINDGRIQFRTVLGKFFCCSASLASGIALGREGPSVQVGAGTRLGDRAESGTQSETGEGAGAGRLRGGAGGGIQYADRGGPVLARRDHGRPARGGAGLRGA